MMSADKQRSGQQCSGKEERDQCARASGDAGKCAVTPGAHDEQTLIISPADAEALLASRFGWTGRGAQPFARRDTGGDPHGDDDVDS
jgi:hypothetical protein